MTRRQCSKCPWRRGVDPTTIPNGYDVELRAAASVALASGLAVCSAVGAPGAR